MSRMTSEEDLLRTSMTGSLPSASVSATSFESAKTLGNEAFRAGRFADAVRHYSDAENINPLSPLPPANRAMAYLKMHRWADAKADAAVALELHNALPAHLQTHPLPVKILLRRATANEHLMLYALAADDYAHVLSRDPTNDVARAKLGDLKNRFGVSPGATGPRPRVQSRPADKITLLSSSPAANGNAHPVPSTSSSPYPTPAKLQDETALVELPQNVMRNLVSRWTDSAPSSAFEFERAWKSLHNEPRARASYLLNIVGAERIRNGLLGESLTPQLLEQIVQVLTGAVRDVPQCAVQVADLLQALTKVPRFDMLLMFLSPSEKRPVESLLDMLGKNGVPAGRVGTLKECYS